MIVSESCAGRPCFDEHDNDCWETSNVGENMDTSERKVLVNFGKHEATRTYHLFVGCLANSHRFDRVQSCLKRADVQNSQDAYGSNAWL